MPPPHGYVSVWQDRVLVHPKKENDTCSDMEQQTHHVQRSPVTNIYHVRERIQEMRLRKNLSIAELASSVQTDMCVLAEFERGEDTISSDTMARIQKFLNI